MTQFVAASRPKDRWLAVGTFSALVATLITGCSASGPHASASTESSMTVQESHQDVLDVFAAITSVVGEDGWAEGTESEWNGCSSQGEAGAQFMLTAIRNQPLSGTPDDVTKRVLEKLESKLGMEGISMQHDETLSPPRTVIGYPNGYNGGTAADGYGLQFQTDPDFVGVIIYGHCVSGDPPKLGTPLNPRPADSRQERSSVHVRVADRTDR